MDNQAMPICENCKRELSLDGYDVNFLKGKLFYKMSCIHCGKETTRLGTIEKGDSKHKFELARA